MNKLQFYLLFLSSCALACLGRTRDTALIVRPDLQESVLGFEISQEENREFCDYIVKRLAGALRLSLVVVDRDALQKSGAQGRPVFCFMITDAHMSSGLQGMHDGFVASVLYKFGSGDSATSPVRYVTPGNLLSMGGWGWDSPFESALHTNLDELCRSLRRTATQAHANGVRLDSLLRDERFVDCGLRTYFVQPEFSDSSFGYTPATAEIHDFTRIVCCHLGKVLGDDVRVVSEKEADDIRDCCDLIARVSFHVPAQRVAFSLEHKGVKTLDKVYNNLDVKDWKENHIFMKGLDNLFGNMDKDIQSSDVRRTGSGMQK